MIPEATEAALEAAATAAEAYRAAERTAWAAWEALTVDAQAARAEAHP